MYISTTAFVILFLISPELAILLGVVLFLCKYPIILAVIFGLWLAIILLSLIMNGIVALIDKIEEDYKGFKEDHKIPDSVCYLLLIIIWALAIIYG